MAEIQSDSEEVGTHVVDLAVNVIAYNYEPLRRSQEQLTLTCQVMKAGMKVQEKRR